jgi:hypothetical protein
MVLGDFFNDAAFWDAHNLIGLGAESLMLAAIILAACAPVGYSWFFIFGVTEAAARLAVAHVGRLAKVPPTHLLLQNNELQAERTAVKSTLAYLRAKMTARQPQRLSAGKGPILLFQQAPLLVAP